MFPIRWNKAYRNKNGSISTIGSEIEGGGGGGYTLPTASADTKGGIKIGNRLTMNGEVLSADAQVPSYTSSDSGKVLTVNSSGELEWDEKGPGGGDYTMSWDFTKFGNMTRSGVVYSNSGALFNTVNSNIRLIDSTGSGYDTVKDITLYIDVTTSQLTSGTNRRFVMGKNTHGLIYRSTGIWGVYTGSWEETEITDPDYFANSKIKIYVDSDSKWHIYKNNVLIFEPTGAITLEYLLLGSDSSSVNAITVTGARIYKGNYTET